ncbi:hypothetical protein V8C37DRAFT_350121 [Trichoderma ceciliae]
MAYQRPHPRRTTADVSRALFSLFSFLFLFPFFFHLPAETILYYMHNDMHHDGPHSKIGLRCNSCNQCTSRCPYHGVRHTRKADCFKHGIVSVFTSLLLALGMARGFAHTLRAVHLLRIPEPSWRALIAQSNPCRNPNHRNTRPGACRQASIATIRTETGSGRGVKKWFDEEIIALNSSHLVSFPLRPLQLQQDDFFSKQRVQSTEVPTRRVGVGPLSFI